MALYIQRINAGTLHCHESMLVEDKAILLYAYWVDVARFLS